MSETEHRFILARAYGPSSPRPKGYAPDKATRIGFRVNQEQLELSTRCSSTNSLVRVVLQVEHPPSITGARRLQITSPVLNKVTDFYEYVLSLLSRTTQYLTDGGSRHWVKSVRVVH